MENSVQHIALEKLGAHPDNPNHQSKVNFARLVRNIERTGRYEPLIVRPDPKRAGHYQIINGHHRCGALTKLGYDKADCIVWDVDDEQTDVLLATLNRLCGRDDAGIKMRLLKRLTKKTAAAELSKLLPQTTKQIKSLVSLKKPTAPAKITKDCFARAIVFFLAEQQHQIVERALLKAQRQEYGGTKAVRRAAALAKTAEYYLKYFAEEG
jgi:ParB/RepB/Spo0J family partition protein